MTDLYQSKVIWRRTILGVSLAALAAAVVTPFAATSQEMVIEEIVVTAQKRAESVQDVPIAITALDAATLQRSQIDSVHDLSFHVPNLQFGNFASTVTVAIRGIGYTNTTAGGDPGVALHLDGVYIGRPIGVAFSSWDLERMEVLRGPQGTLYGRNTTGGSINFITNKPTDEFEVKGEISYGRFQHVEARTTLNVPLGEKAAGRFNFSFTESDGYQKNLVPGGTESNDNDSVTFRGQVRFDLNENFQFLVSGTLANKTGIGSTSEIRLPFRTQEERFGPPFLELGFRDFSGLPDQFLQTIFSDEFFNRPDINAILASRGINSIADIEAFFGFTVFPEGPKFSDAALNDLTPNVVSKNTPEDTRLELRNITGTLTWDVGWGTIKSISSYNETMLFSFIDLDATEIFIQNLQLDETQDQFSQELQVSSNSGERLEWIIGAYFFTEDATRISTIFEHDFDLFGALLGRDAGFRVGGSVEAESYAFFSHASFDITDQFQITGGFRWSWDDKDALISLLSPFPAFDKATIIDNVPASGSWNEPSGKVSLDWKPMANVLLYTSFSHGYKSGGINLNGAPATAVYDPEFNNVWEIGAKTQFFNRIRINVAAFINDYKDIQVQVFGPTGAIIENAAAATIKGAELEALFLVTETMELDIALGLLDAEFDDFPFTPPALPFPPVGPRACSGGPTCTISFGAPATNFAGNKLSRAPSVTLSAGLQQKFYLTDGMGSVTFRAEFYYQDEQFFDPDNEADARGDSYHNLDLRLRWDSDGGEFNAEAFVTNVTDQNQIRDVLISIPFLGLGVDLTTFNAPRRWGFRFGFSY